MRKRNRRLKLTERDRQTAFIMFLPDVRIDPSRLTHVEDRMTWSGLSPMVVFGVSGVVQELTDLWWNNAHSEWSKSNGPPHFIWQGQHLNTSS
jgi:hypothetical protein